MATITFNKNGGTGGTDSIDSTSPLTQISVPHKNGYNFIGYVDTVTDTMYYEGGGKLDTSLSTSSINNLTAQYIPMPVYIDTNFNGVSANYGYYGQETIYQSSNDYITTIGKDNLSLVFDGEYTSSYNPFSYGKNANVDIFVDKDEWSENYCLCVGLVYNSGTFEDTGEGTIDCGIELLDGFGKNLSYIIYQSFPNSNHPYWGVVFGSGCKSSITTKYVRIRIKLLLGENAELTTEEYSIRPIVYFIPDTRYEMTSLYSVTSRNNMPIGLVDITNNNINVITQSDDEYSYPLKFTQTTHNESNSVDTNFKADRYKVTYTSGNLTTLNDNLTHLQQMMSNEGLNTNLYNNSFKLIQNWKLNHNMWYQSQPHLKAGGVWRDVIVPTIKEHINRLVFTNAYVWAQVSQVLTHKQLGGYTYNELYNLDIPYNELTDTYKHYQGYTHDELSNSKHESIGELEE